MLRSACAKLRAASAQLYQEIAEMHEEDSEMGSAMAAYSQSADLFLAENSKSAASKCQNKVALLAAQEGNYDLAIDTFEAIAATCLESNLLKFNAKGYFLCAGVCGLLLAWPLALASTVVAPACSFVRPC